MLKFIFNLVKERGAYEDENGNPVLAPWMVPPEDIPSSSGAEGRSSLGLGQHHFGSDSTNLNVSAQFIYTYAVLATFTKIISIRAIQHFQAEE